MCGLPVGTSKSHPLLIQNYLKQNAPSAGGEDGNEHEVVQGLGRWVEPGGDELQAGDENVVDWGVVPVTQAGPDCRPVHGQIETDVREVALEEELVCTSHKVAVTVERDDEHHRCSTGECGHLAVLADGAWIPQSL